jgi:hypothetical protein
LKPGYVEEWWGLELGKSGKKIENYFKVSFDDAVNYSNEFNIALHPKYIFYWTEINYQQFLGFIDWLEHSRVNEGKLLFPYNKSESDRFKVGKRALELLGIEHSVGVENVILEKVEAQALLANLGIQEGDGEVHLNYKFKRYEELFEDGENEGDKVLEIVNELSDLEIKDKAGDFIGTRLGRP